MKVAKDHPVSEEFALYAGKLIQNFGVVEVVSYRWIELLSGSAIAAEISKELPLARRIEIVLNLLARDPKVPQITKERATGLWRQVRDKGCEIRNAVAHGTVLLALPDGDTTQPPKLAGILKSRRWQDEDHLVSLEELKAAVNTTSRIAEELVEVAEVLRTASSAPLAPPGTVAGPKSTRDK